ncbi:unnamed protein product [Clonostachys rhizophaga]|uniref:Cation/H+ exchanger transmembrane domain-containing protein n=1 Tax=Clonostachys rhizophaga TaxID=160324 RepID=A0A9N9V911_9HYPO|nr:unnamed protein product [Clonostachys rhizophaga]
MSDSGDRAPSQAGVLEGLNPSKYNSNDPIILFIIQAGLILITCHLLHWPLAKIRQPRVIAEVVGGIILGPSVMGRIPGFKNAIFPTESLPGLSLVANLGLVLYLFLIGMETNVRFLISNWRIASAVAVGGLALPFGLGCALAWGLYHQFRDEEGLVHIEFSTYMLFIGVAIAITAFPVLCRILTELNLLSTTAGIITLSAGVANDVIGWILLALCVTLANAGNGLTSLYILLCCLGYLLLLLYVIKPLLYRFIKWMGNLETGPSQSVIALILLVALASAFFTGIIGVHPIFGGFMVGLIVPRDNGFALKVTEKLEDVIGALFLPLYFTLSGLKTNLGLLDNGITWGYVFAVTLTAFFSKIIGATLAARFSGIVWRESFTIGALMSCKGLVELIVLNIGLQAKILSTRTFTIFVVMALLTTFTTTPLVTFLYPVWYQEKLAAWKRGEIEWDDTTRPSQTTDDAITSKDIPSNNRVNQLMVYLRLDNLPGLLNLVSLFGNEATVDEYQTDDSHSHGHFSPEKDKAPASPPVRSVKAHGLRLIQLGDRDSAVMTVRDTTGMTVSEIEEYTRNDPILNTWRIVGQLFRVAVSGEVATMLGSRFAEALLTKASNISADLLVVPWSGSGTLDDSAQHVHESKLSSSYLQFTNSVYASNQRSIGVYFPKRAVHVEASQPDSPNRLQRTFSFSDIHREINPLPVKKKAQRIILPFFGGNDDRLALMLLYQLCEKREVSAIVYHMYSDHSESDDREYLRAVSESVKQSISARVEIKFNPTNDVADELVSNIASAIQKDTGDTTWNNLVLIGRRGAAGKLPNGKARAEAPGDVVDCLGGAAALLISSEIEADLLVIQAKTTA